MYVISLYIFLIGNILTYFSPNFTFMMIARILTAMSTALVVVLSLTIAAKIVHPSYRAKALGLIYMGISSSLVLGVPLGILISKTHLAGELFFMYCYFIIGIHHLNLSIFRENTWRGKPNSSIYSIKGRV